MMTNNESRDKDNVDSVLQFRDYVKKNIRIANSNEYEKVESS